MSTYDDQENELVQKFDNETMPEMSMIVIIPGDVSPFSGSGEIGGMDPIFSILSQLMGSSGLVDSQRGNPESDEANTDGFLEALQAFMGMMSLPEEAIYELVSQ